MVRRMLVLALLLPTLPGCAGQRPQPTHASILYRARALGVQVVPIAANGRLDNAAVLAEVPTTQESAASLPPDTASPHWIGRVRVSEEIAGFMVADAAGSKRLGNCWLCGDAELVSKMIEEFQ